VGGAHKNLFRLLLKNSGAVHMKTVLVRANKERQIGQGMTEYIIIVAMIAVAAIGVYSMFGKTIRNQTSGLAHEVAGQKADQQVGDAGKAAKEAYDRANKNKGMSQYHNENDAGDGAGQGQQ
jgi:Flp pilus assembly pilin Flp